MTQDEKQKALNLEVAQGMFQKFKDDHIGIPNQSEAIYYTQQEADAYNAELAGALNSTDPLTAEEAAAYNAAVTGASKEAGDTLSSAEAAAYNATLEGAVSTSDIKTPAVPTKVKKYVDDGLSGKADLGNDGKVPSSQLPEIDTFPDQTGQSGKFLTTDGTDASWAEVNMSAKADKLPMTGEGAATENNFMAIDANGNIKDSGKNQNSFQAPLTFDTTPTANSTNPVTSGGVYDAASKLKSDIDFVRQQLLVDDPGRVIMTTETNPEVLAICHERGWCADSGYMTYAEAQAVTDIGTVFMQNTNITHFEELQYFGITSLHNTAFSGCTNLTKIGIPDSVVTWGANSFQNCRNIQELYITDLNKYIDVADFVNANAAPCKKNHSRLFLNNHLIKVLSIPANKTVGEKAFQGFDFDEVILVPNITRLKYRAFALCAIGKVTIKVTSLAEWVESGCDIDIYLDSDPRNNANGNVYINDTLLEGEITIPSTCTQIGLNAFRSCTRITSVIIGNNITKIEQQAFMLCLFSSINIPNSVTVIGSGCFNSCYNITSLIIPPNCNSVYNLFSKCTSLESVTFQSANLPNVDQQYWNNNTNLRELKFYAQTAPNMIYEYKYTWPYAGEKIIYVPSNSTGYDTGRWKTEFLDRGWTLSKTL